jgi:hypothetical protein
MENTQAWMREESRQNRELMQLLLNRNQVGLVATLQPTSPSPPLLIGNHASGSNNSGALSPQELEKLAPPLPVESPIRAPLPLIEDNVLEGTPSARCQGVFDEREEGGEGVMTIGTEEIDVGHNLTVDASKVELGSGSLPTKDPLIGCAQ